MPSVITQTNANTEASPGESATAVIYLRVSSSGQLTGRSEEGYSIEGQREACERHAERLGASIIGEYVEPGKTATNTRRPALQRMLAQLGKLRPTFVIFYDLSRVAREEQDAFWLLAEIKRHGAKLESTLERVDDSPQGLFMFGIMASVNAFRSRGDGEKVKLGLDRKFADGGTHGAARVGYLNTREMVNGKEVRSIAVDEERAELVRIGFEAFATGEYSITTLCELLDEIGLRTRSTPKRSAKPLSRNGVYRMLRDDYYIGVVTRCGVKREGRHEAIIDPAIFEKVQRTLEAHRLSGDRTKKHAHYLKGSIFCGHCGGRLVYGRHRGNGGVYEYFNCLSYQTRRSNCGARHLPVEGVEHAVEDYYRSIQLTPAECAKIRRELKQQVGVRLEVARKQSERHNRRLRDLQSEQQKLIHLYYRGGVSEEVLQAEQQRIETERTQARRWVESATHEAKEANDALDEALAIVQNCHATYIAGDPERRRLMNQAVFERILIRVGWLEGEEEPIYEHIRSLGGSSTPARPNPPRNGQDPQFFGGLGSNVGQLVQRSGGYWNQDSGAIDKVVSELLAALAAQEARSGLSRLAKKLAVLRASDAQPRAIMSRRQRPRRPGWVLDAVRAVMADQAGPMRVAQVHAAVEALLGEAVSKDSVSWCLSAGAHRKERLFVRIARGRYVLAGDAGTRKAQAQRTQSSAVRRTVLGCVLRASPDK